MNREIKFRAQVKWNGNHYFSGEWVYGDLIRHEYGKTYIYDTEEEIMYLPNGKRGFPGPRYEYVEVIEETVGQYTGEKDIDGNEIYTGDILLKHYEYPEEEPVVINDICDIYDIDSPDEKSKVVGNIHDERASEDEPKG